jgi:hypothetical protein
VAFFWGVGGEAVLELELRALTLSHSTSPIFVKGFADYFSVLASNRDPSEYLGLQVSHRHLVAIFYCLSQV